MIANEIQLQYVIPDKIQSETKYGPRQIQSKMMFETKFSSRKHLRTFFPTIFFCHKIFFYQKQNFVGKKNSQLFSQTEFCLGRCLGLNF